MLATGLSAQLKFNHTLDQTDFNDPTVVVNKQYSPSFSGNIVTFDRGLDAVSGNDAYIDIALEGAPMSISFDIAISSDIAMVLPNALLPMCWLSESSDGSNYSLSRTWRHSLSQVGTSYSAKTVTLKPQTRFVRIGYRATLKGYYRNIVVTPLHADVQLNVDARALDFGRMPVNTTDHSDDKTMDLNANWRNLKNITVAVDKFDNETAKNMYSANPNTLGTSELSNGNGSIDLTNNPNAAKGEYKVDATTKKGAVVRIHADSPYDNDERICNIPLSVILCGNRRTINWYEGQDTIVVRNGVTLDQATINPSTGGAKVTYRTITKGNKGTATVNSTTLKVSDIPTMGVIDMEAYCNGTGDYADASVKRTFVVMPEHGLLYETSLCEGDSIKMGGQKITADGDKTQTITLLTEDGQNDSTIFVIVHTNKKYDGIQTSARVHQDDLPFYWEGLTFTQAGSQTATIKTIAGCDSSVTMTLKVDTSYHVYKQVCRTEFPYEWKVGDDVIYTFNDYGKYTYTFETAVSDSNVTWFVMPYDTIYVDTLYHTICPGNSYEWRQKIYTETGIYGDTVQGICEDTVYTLNLTVQTPKTEPSINSTICAADTLNFEWHGQRYVSGKDVYRDTAYFAETGCDSVYYELHLTVQTPKTEPPIDSIICAADTLNFEWHGQRYVSGKDVYRDTAYFAETGCDSVYYELHLTVQTPKTEPPIDSIICAADTLNFE
ncbi:MAG: hypothetical protein MJZ64_03825, partial [Paludibacteraceae bacterium]|nr:hypothetical protein [Paludibacteraceae bacterium]